MVLIMGQMAMLIIAGVAWRIIRPGGLDADLLRTALTALVFNLLMPALVLSVLWRAQLGVESLLISLFGILTILFGAVVTGLLTSRWQCSRQQRGAAMLAVTFPNVTYLGLPVLEQTFGAWSRSIVIQIDLFAGLPMALTVGMLIARRFGEESDQRHAHPLQTLLRNPPLWAAALALPLNLNGVLPPFWLERPLEQLANAVIPLMLISLGLGLKLESWRWRNATLSIAVLLLRLVIVPLLGLALGWYMGFSGDKLNALVLESAMPSMLLGVVICDRYRLDTAFYAMSVALTTLCAMVTLPIWHHQIQSLRFFS